MEMVICFTIQTGGCSRKIHMQVVVSETVHNAARYYFNPCQWSRAWHADCGFPGRPCESLIGDGICCIIELFRLPAMYELIYNLP